MDYINDSKQRQNFATIARYTGGYALPPERAEHGDKCTCVNCPARCECGAELEYDDIDTCKACDVKLLAEGGVR